MTTKGLGTARPARPRGPSGKRRKEVTDGRMASIAALVAGGIKRNKDLAFLIGLDADQVTKPIIAAACAKGDDHFPDMLAERVACGTCGGRMLFVPCVSCMAKHRIPQYTIPKADAERKQIYQHDWTPTRRSGGFDIWNPVLQSSSVFPKKGVVYHQWVADVVELTGRAAEDVILFLHER